VQRAKTMGTLLKSIVSGIIAAIVITMMLAEVGLNIGPIIASAGIVGVALGFGSQTLVKDFLSGIFMIFEDQFGVGDVVDMGEGLTGTVEAVSLRVTRLRDTNGTVWYVRNGELYRVGNMSQNWARAVLDVQVSAREDVNRVRRVLADVTHDLWEDEEYDGVIIEEPEVWGIEAITPDAITLRVALKTAPMEQWRVARVLRARIKARFDHEGIQAPYPTSYVMNRTPGDPEAAAAADAPDSADDS
jgi:small conductance mechanosensitive channel